MSNFHFGVDGYDLNYYPSEASDDNGGVDWNKVEYVEIECDVYVKERTCTNTSYRIDESRFHCSACGFGCWVKDVADGKDKQPSFCPNCGAKVVE